MANKVEEIMAINDPVRQLVRIMEILRSPGGCPWDRKQTHESLMRYLQEECAETVDAALEKDYPGMCDELGDLLMNIVFSSVVAQEEQHFDFDDVAKSSVAKMIRRHPHVFGEAQADTAEQVLKVWAEVKRTERTHQKRVSLLDGTPQSLSALSRADKIQRKAAEAGFDWNETSQVIDKIEEEIREVREAMASGNEEHIDEELGDLMFALVNLARRRKRRNAEELLRAAIQKFERRFHYVEEQAEASHQELKNCTLSEMDNWWNEAKAQEKKQVH